MKDLLNEIRENWFFILFNVVVASVVFNFFGMNDIFVKVWFDGGEVYIADGYVPGLSQNNGRHVEWSDSIYEEKVKLKWSYGDRDCNIEVCYDSDFDLYHIDGYLTNVNVERFKDGEIYTYRKCEDVRSNPYTITKIVRNGKCEFIQIVNNKTGERSHGFRISKRIESDRRKLIPRLRIS